MTVEAHAKSSTPIGILAISLCLALILIYPFIATNAENAVGPLAAKIGEMPARFVGEGALWLFAALVLSIAVFGEPRTLQSIGLRRLTVWTPLWGIGAAVALIALGGAASYVTYSLLHAPNRTPEQVEALIRGSLVYGLFLALRGGVIEEVFYRGLAIEQLTVLTGRRWLSAFVVTIAFVVVHGVHFDPRQLVPIATAGFALAALYLWRRNLWINIIAHTLVDALAFTVVAMHATSLY